jgi:L-fuculose-phosphate aldolase
MTREERRLRQDIISKACWMNACGLNQGTSGNISARYRDVMLITPSAIPYERLRPDMIAAFRLDRNGEWSGPAEPSTEWRLHFAIMTSRPAVSGIVHAHSIYATALAICRRSIPACHYLMAAFGGMDIRCAAYARYGTSDLTVHALKALEDRHACLLANHGMIATGRDLEHAMWLAVELETIAKQYYLSLLIDGPVLLNEAEIEATREGFSSDSGEQPNPQRRGRAGSRRRASLSPRAAL